MLTEKKLWTDDDEENDTFSSYVALDDVTVFEAAGLDAIALLADLDPEVSAQLVQASAQAYFFFRKTKEKVKGKAKGKGNGRYLVHPSHLSLEDRRSGRKVDWANDRECATCISSSSTRMLTRTVRMATRQQFSNQANQAGVCFVLNEYSDDPDTSAYMVSQNVPLPTEATEQIPLTPTASAAVDIRNTAAVNDRAKDDNDEIWATEADHRTGWNKAFKSGTYRGMLYGIVLRDYLKQVASLTKAKGVSTNMREFLCWAQRHYRIEVTASTVESKMGGLASAGACPVGCKEFSHKFSNAHSIRLTCNICGTVRKEERHPQRVSTRRSRSNKLILRQE